MAKHWMGGATTCHSWSESSNTPRIGSGAWHPAPFILGYIFLGFAGQVSFTSVEHSSSRSAPRAEPRTSSWWSVSTWSTSTLLVMSRLPSRLKMSFANGVYGIVNDTPIRVGLQPFPIAGLVFCLSHYCSSFSRCLLVYYFSYSCIIATCVLHAFLYTLIHVLLILLLILLFVLLFKEVNIENQ